MANLNISLLTRLTNDELIEQLAMSCYSSPIVMLLIKRLEETVKTIVPIPLEVSGPMQLDTQCPVCLTDYLAVITEDGTCDLQEKS